MKINNAIIVFVNTLLIIASSYYIVQSFWLYLLKNQVQTNNNPILTQKVNANQSYTIKPIFGEKIKTPEVKKIVAPKETKLNLKLKGIWLGRKNTKSYVLINVNNKDEIYTVGDSISSLAEIENIYANYITINRAGIIESLYLRQNDISIRKTPSKQEKSTEKKVPNNQQLQPKLSNNDINNLKQIKKSLATNPWTLSKIINISPHYKNGKLQGFIIRPGRQRQLFDKLQLKSGDVIYEVNNSPLTFQSLPSVLNTVLNNNNININLYRNDEPLTLTLTL